MGTRVYYNGQQLRDLIAVEISVSASPSQDVQATFPSQDVQATLTVLAPKVSARVVEGAVEIVHQDD
jgi:hypothetical protein